MATRGQHVAKLPIALWFIETFSSADVLGSVCLFCGEPTPQVLSCVLSRLVAANDALPDQGVVTKFHALRPPSISIRDYLERINKYANCSPECFVLALVYIDRLIQRNALLLSSLNVHRVIITATMLAAKFFDDQYFNNAYYAKVGGVPTPEVNSLELEFLFSINFSLHVPSATYGKYVAELSNHMVASTSESSASVVGAIGTPPCDCSKVAPLAYTAEELRYTGMRSAAGGSLGELVLLAGDAEREGGASVLVPPGSPAATAAAAAAVGELVAGAGEQSAFVEAERLKSTVATSSVPSIVGGGSEVIATSGAMEVDGSGSCGQ